MNRENIIKLAVKHNGEYDRIVKGINEQDDVSNVSLEGINAITIFDKEYPKELLELKYPPFVLFYKGNLDLLGMEKIAVCGSRNHTNYSAKVTRDLVLTNNDKAIVCGLAKGIDTITMHNAEHPIAVLGCGIDYIYPQCNSDLFNVVERKGLILSEYPFYTKPLSYHFPFRNRIIVALSKKTYVMEARQTSSNAIDTALELGKDIEVLPFDVFTELANGIKNNDYIREGAKALSLF